MNFIILYLTNDSKATIQGHFLPLYWEFPTVSSDIESRSDSISAVLYCIDLGYILLLAIMTTSHSFEKDGRKLIIPERKRVYDKISNFSEFLIRNYDIKLIETELKSCVRDIMALSKDNENDALYLLLNLIITPMYIRDCRKGCGEVGERKVVHEVYRLIAKEFPNVVIFIYKHMPEYGGKHEDWNDFMYLLGDTEDEFYKEFRANAVNWYAIQLRQDHEEMEISKMKNKLLRYKVLFKISEIYANTIFQKELENSSFKAISDSMVKNIKSLKLPVDVIRIWIEDEISLIYTSNTKCVTYAAKWIPSPKDKFCKFDPTFIKKISKQLFPKIKKGPHLEKALRQLYSPLRQFIGIPETKMCEKKRSDLNFNNGTVPVGFIKNCKYALLGMLSKYQISRTIRYRYTTPTNRDREISHYIRGPRFDSENLDSENARLKFIHSELYLSSTSSSIKNVVEMALNTSINRDYIEAKLLHLFNHMKMSWTSRDSKVTVVFSSMNKNKFYYIAMFIAMFHHTLCGREALISSASGMKWTNMSRQTSLASKIMYLSNQMAINKVDFKMIINKLQEKDYTNTNLLIVHHAYMTSNALIGDSSKWEKISRRSDFNKYISCIYLNCNISKPHKKVVPIMTWNAFNTTRLLIGTRFGLSQSQHINKQLSDNKWKVIRNEILLNTKLQKELKIKDKKKKQDFLTNVISYAITCFIWLYIYFSSLYNKKKVR